MNRKLKVSDVVCFRPDALCKLSREHKRRCDPHVAMHVVCVFTSFHGYKARRCLELRDDFFVYTYAWPSEVRLADGQAERMSVRREKFRKQIEKDKQDARDLRASRGKKTRNLDSSGGTRL